MHKMHTGRMLFLFSFSLFSLFVVNLCGQKGDNGEDEDVYTTKDPAKREPSPCEGGLDLLLS